MFTGRTPRSDGTDPRSGLPPASLPTAPSTDTSPHLNPLRSLTGPAVPRATTTGDEPPGEPPVRATPTDSWSYRWLGVGVAAGTAAALVVAASATWLSTSLLSATSSTWVVAATLAFAAAKGAKPILVGIFGDKLLAKLDDYAPQNTTRRVEDTVRTLCVKAGCDMCAVVTSSSAKNMAMFDGPGKANVLIYNPDFVEKLTDRELQGIVAHELSHANRVSTIGRIAMASAHGIAGITTLVGTASYCLSMGHGVLASSMLAFGGAVTVGAVIMGCRNIASRAAEMRTDIRAVELTGDVGGFIAGLRTAYDYMRGDLKLPPLLRGLQSLGSHPPFDVRERWIRRACGNKPATEKATTEPSQSVS